MPQSGCRILRRQAMLRARVFEHLCTFISEAWSSEGSDSRSELRKSDASKHVRRQYDQGISGEWEPVRVPAVDAITAGNLLSTILERFTVRLKRFCLTDGERFPSRMAPAETVHRPSRQCRGRPPANPAGGKFGQILRSSDLAVPPVRPRRALDLDAHLPPAERFNLGETFYSKDSSSISGASSRNGAKDTLCHRATAPWVVIAARWRGVA